MKLTKIAAIFAVVAGLLAPIAASAETVSLKMVMVPKETIRMKFGDGTKHFVAMVRREGKSEGTGALGGASVTEYGWHDINPPVGADPHGYLQFKAANGDLANIKWTVRAVFFKGAKKPKLVDYGHWELVSGSGSFADMTGVGTLTIKPASKTDRLFSLEGEIGPKP